MSKVSDILRQIRPELKIDESTDFFEEGALDSFDLVSLVTDLDSTYGISIDGLDIVPENFGSVAKIEALLRRYGVTP
jgi:acyl carrier protein